MYVPAAEIITLIVITELSFVSSIVSSSEELYRLDIIHFNDFHARVFSPIVACMTENISYINHHLACLQPLRFEETTAVTPTCRFNNGSCLGGFPRLYRAVKDLKREKPESILLNAGDSFQGTYWYTLLKWNVTQEFMNLLPHDAHTVGNHDFDDGPQGLAPYLLALKAPVIAANMDSSKEPLLQNLYKPYVVLQRRGRKIGIIGLITPDTKTLSFTGNVEFTDPSDTTKRVARKLTESGVDIIILLSHCGYDMDISLAREHGQHIDVIVGGHSHRDESFFKPYITIVNSDVDKTKRTVVVQASAFTKILGSLSVYFDVNGNVAKWNEAPIALDKSMPEDEEIKAKLAPYAKLVHEAENTVVGEIRSSLNYHECAYGECKLGNLLTDALNHWTRRITKSKYECISFIQRSNINAILPQGPITKGAIIDFFPYYDFVESFELEGRHIWKLLERSMTELSSLDRAEGPWILQFSGIRVRYNVTEPEGCRVVSVYVGEGTSGKKLNKDGTYQVTAPAYLADGGDGYSVFKQEKKNVQILGRDQILLEKYIKMFSPLTVIIDGRMIITY